MSLRTTSFLLLVAIMVSLPNGLRAQGLDDQEVAIHGMLVVGTNHIYISHLPMFSIPHRFQGIWEVSFGDEADNKFRNSRNSTENQKLIYTLAPRERFPLKSLADSRNHFRADVYAGHFERSGHKVLLENVEVKLLRKIHFHQFETTDSRPENLSYVLFGKVSTDETGRISGDSELFLAHSIIVPPTYDQVLIISHVQGPVNRGGVPLWQEGASIVLSDRMDTKKLGEGQKARGEIQLTGSGNEERKGPIEFEVHSEYYLEQQELAESSLR